MKYVTDHDYHIHSTLSSCCNDAEQTKENILRYAKENGLKRICLTDHFWDSSVPFWDGGVSGSASWYAPQNYEHIATALPLPTDEEVEFLFGCETELDKLMTLGLSPEKYDRFDFIIVPTTHLHMKDFIIEKSASVEERARAYVDRLDAVLDMELPFHKVGIAHLTCPLIDKSERDAHIRVIDSVSDEEFTRLFEKSAKVGVGIELNFPIGMYSEDELERILRPYRIAKACKNKFYMGSDAHSVGSMRSRLARFGAYVEKLGLEESDKFLLKADLK